MRSPSVSDQVSTSTRRPPSEAAPPVNRDQSGLQTGRSQHSRVTQAQQELASTLPRASLGSYPAQLFFWYGEPRIHKGNELKVKTAAIYFIL